MNKLKNREHGESFGILEEKQAPRYQSPGKTDTREIIGLTDENSSLFVSDQFSQPSEHGSSFVVDNLTKNDIVEEMMRYSLLPEAVDRVNFYFYKERSFWKLLSRFLNKNFGFDKSTDPVTSSVSSANLVSRIYTNPHMARILAGILWLEDLAKNTYITSDIETQLRKCEHVSANPDSVSRKTLSKSQIDDEDFRLRVIWCYLRCGMYSQAVESCLGSNQFWRASMLCGKDYDSITYENYSQLDDGDENQRVSVIGNSKYSIWRSIVSRISTKWSTTAKELENDDHPSSTQLLSCAKLESAIFSLLCGNIDELMANQSVMLSWDDKVWAVLKCFLDCKIANKIIERDQLRNDDIRRAIHGCFPLDGDAQTHFIPLAPTKETDIASLLSKFHIHPSRIGKLSIDDVVMDPTWLLRSCSLSLITGDNDRINEMIGNIVVPYVDQLFELYGSKLSKSHLVASIDWKRIKVLFANNSLDSKQIQFNIYSKTLLRLCFMIAEHCKDFFPSLLSDSTRNDCSLIIELYCLYTLKVSHEPFYIPRLSLLLDTDTRERVLIETVIQICSVDSFESEAGRFYACFQAQGKLSFLPFIIQTSKLVRCSKSIENVHLLHRNMISLLLRLDQSTEALGHAIAICRKLGTMDTVEDWTGIMIDLLSLLFPEAPESANRLDHARRLLIELPAAFTGDDYSCHLFDDWETSHQTRSGITGRSSMWSLLLSFCVCLHRIDDDDANILELVELYLVMLSKADDDDLDLIVRLLVILQYKVRQQSSGTIIRISIALLPTTFKHFNSIKDNKHSDSSCMCNRQVDLLLSSTRQLSLELLRRREYFVSPL